MTWSTAFNQEGNSFQTAGKDSKEVPSIKVWQLKYTKHEEEVNVSPHFRDIEQRRGKLKTLSEKLLQKLRPTLAT